ncbi:chondroitin sulfate synthase 2 [Cephus cinctus]|uniref:Hexosyltransferase n=1 Tax=Cephus cinctus TaxID=211228 RepID=A0AAJ7FLD9_CEPCN|nr:chondroitin sulfate synthase 2 [Cephus cinctus]
MSAVIKMLFSHCRSNLYLIVGICMGLSLSLFFAPVEIDECHEGSDSLPYMVDTHNFNDEYEPKINIEGKPQHAQKTPKVFVRPRYYSTELGIRDKLFVGVITNREYLHSRGVALNKTIAHLVDKVRYFISIPEGTKPNVSLPGIVGFTDTRSILKPFHIMKYITDNYLEDYDYYYLIKDASYINARRLIELVNKISVSQDIHMGVPGDTETYCSLDAGILLSNSIIREMKTNLDWCVKNTYSDSDDINFGRCIVHSLPVLCTSTSQGQTFHSEKLDPTFHFETSLSKLIANSNIADSVSIYPIYDHTVVYKMSAYIATTELAKVQKKISELRKVILKTAHLGPKDKRNVSWPVGNQPGNKPPGRFDVLRWTYFNETHTFLENDMDILRELHGSTKMDVDQVTKTAVERIENKYDGELKFKKLVNGYRKLDASRGMDYILDISFTELSTGKESIKRVEVCKPLGKVEILPVPYVTENSRINMILMANPQKKTETLTFMKKYAENCMEKKDKTFLMVVLLYDPSALSRGKEDVFYDIKQLALILTEKYKKDQSKVSWLSIRLPTAFTAIELDPMLRIAIADLSVKKFTAESLILFTDPGIDLRSDYLNRVRMNTISQWQIFSPIPFTGYHPDIAYAEDIKHVEMDITRNHGRYDDTNFESISFYAKDYTTMRKTIEPLSIPLVRTDKDIPELLKLSSQTLIESLFDMFVSFSDLHCFRAVEPALKIRYKDVSCAGTRSDVAYKKCIRERSFRLGHRGQLAKLILEYQSSQ